MTDAAAQNPYNCSRPKNCFVGYQPERERILRGLRNGKSYALVGGRRCGKTSLLLTLQEDLERPSALGPLRPLPRFLDVHALSIRSAEDFFRALYARAVEGTPAKAWDGSRAEPPYDSFLQQLDAARPGLERQHGPDWVVVLLIDELDAAAATLPDEQCFQNLRNFLSVSRYSRHFRAVCSGVSRLTALIQHGSPLNILDPENVRALLPEEVTQLLGAGFPPGLEPATAAALQAQAGRHPYLLQGLLEQLWDDREELGPDAVHRAASRFVRGRQGTLRTWLQDIGPGGQAVYRALAEDQQSPGADGPLTVQHLKKRLSGVTEGLLSLAHHGVIDEREMDRPVALGQLFRDWFLENHRPEDVPADARAEPAAVPREDGSPRHVFVVHGRNERLRVAMFTFLRAIGLEPLEWSQMVEEVGTAAPYIGDVLKAGLRKAHAVVVLFTPDEEARLLPEFRTGHDLDGSELRPQPRPNVLFEAGMAMALFPTRTVLVQVGPMRQLSDLSGIHLVQLDSSLGKRQELARRLKNAGCAVKTEESTLWQTAGDFSLPARAPGANRP